MNEPYFIYALSGSFFDRMEELQASESRGELLERSAILSGMLQAMMDYAECLEDEAQAEHWCKLVDDWTAQVNQAKMKRFTELANMRGGQEHD